MGATPVAIFPVLEVEEGGIWRKIAELPLAAVPATASFDAVTARRFRIVLDANPYPGKPGLGESAPGAVAFNMFGGADGKPISLRANVINLFDANYWVATSSFFVQNQPRTFMLSLAADF